MDKLILRQEPGQQFYYIYTAQGILIGQIFTGADGQYIRDAECIKAVGRALAKRWGICQK